MTCCCDLSFGSYSFRSFGRWSASCWFRLSWFIWITNYTNFQNVFDICIKMKNNKIPHRRDNRRNRQYIYISPYHITTAHYITWYRHFTKRGRVKLVLLTGTVHLSEMLRSRKHLPRVNQIGTLTYNRWVECYYEELSNLELNTDYI